MDTPRTDPADLLRCRDSIYAGDLVVAATAWLGFFDWLSDSPARASDVCDSLEITERPADVMLTLLCAMKLIERRGDRFQLTDLSREFLTTNSRWSLGPYFATMRERPTCKDMLAVLRTGRPASWGSKENGHEWAKAMERESVAQGFTAAMDGRGAYLAPELASRIDFGGYSFLLDIAGGSGVYSCAIAARNEFLKAAVLEKPPVDAITRKSIAEQGMASRVSAVAGDMFREIPPGYDIHLLSNCLHDWGESAVVRILENCFASLPAGGMIVIHDAHVDEGKTGPLPVAEYSVLLMYSTEGKCYSVGEIRDMLAGAGFVDATFIPTVAWRSAITAKKPH